MNEEFLKRRIREMVEGATKEKLEFVYHFLLRGTAKRDEEIAPDD